MYQLGKRTKNQQYCLPIVKQVISMMVRDAVTESVLQDYKEDPHHHIYAVVAAYEKLAEDILVLIPG